MLLLLLLPLAVLLLIMILPPLRLLLLLLLSLLLLHKRNDKMIKMNKKKKKCPPRLHLLSKAAQRPPLEVDSPGSDARPRQGQDACADPNVCLELYLLLLFFRLFDTKEKSRFLRGRGHARGGTGQGSRKNLQAGRMTRSCSQCVQNVSRRTPPQADLLPAAW